MAGWPCRAWVSGRYRGGQVLRLFAVMLPAGMSLEFLFYGRIPKGVSVGTDCPQDAGCTKGKAAGGTESLIFGRHVVAMYLQTKEKDMEERVNSIMKTRKIRNFRRTVVAGLAAFMMLAESVTAFACPAVAHDDAQCTCAEEAHNEVILFDEQFVDVDGNVTPVSGISPRLICLKHTIVEGYFQTHVRDGRGGCTVKTYHSTRCVCCNTIWMGDLCAVAEFVTCTHDI